MESIKGKCEGVARARWNTVTYQALRRRLHTPLPTLHGGEKQRREKGQVSQSVGGRTHTLSPSLHSVAAVCSYTAPSTLNIVFSTVVKFFCVLAPF